jgi:hypothetical protein
MELTGRCNCGNVSFVAIGPFRAAKACHCKTCRRQSGHYLAATEVRRENLAIAETETLTWFSASTIARRGFCRNCGVHLFWERHGSGRVSILMGCLDDPTGLGLADHIFIAEKGDYYEITDGLPQRMKY